MAKTSLALRLLSKGLFYIRGMGIFSVNPLNKSDENQWFQA